MVHDYADDHKDGHDMLYTKSVHIFSPTEGSHTQGHLLLLGSQHHLRTCNLNISYLLHAFLHLPRQQTHFRMLQRYTEPIEILSSSHKIILYLFNYH